MKAQNNDHHELSVNEFIGETINAQVIPFANPAQIELSSAQKKFLNRLVSQMGRMEEALKGAEDAAERAKASYDLAYHNASEYVVTCSEERGITLGEDGWQFVQTAMAFVRQVGQEPSGINSNGVGEG